MGGGGIEEVNGSKRATILVLVGRTGNGKSATGNTIVGRQAFTSFWSLSSVTKQCKLEQSTGIDGRLLNVVDTPGLFDPKTSQESLMNEIVKCIGLAKDGIHGIILVLSIKNRFTEEEATVLDKLQLLFGPKIVNYMIVVFTGGDKLDKNGLTLEDEANEFPQQLKEILGRCNRRMVLFDNKTTLETKKERQINELLYNVDTIIDENGGQPYSNELFPQAEALSKECPSTREWEKANEELLRGLIKKMEESHLLLRSQMAEMALSSKKSTEEIHKLQEDLNRAHSQMQENQLVLRCQMAEMAKSGEISAEQICKLQEDLKRAHQKIEELSNSWWNRWWNGWWNRWWGKRTNM